MVGETFQLITVVFSLVTGTAAGLVSLLAWETLRRSPFGRAVFVLSLVMVSFIGYHVLVLVVDPLPVVVRPLKSVLFTGAAAFVWTMVWSQHRLRRAAGAEGSVS